MHKAVIVGNLVRDPEMRTTPNGVSVTSFTVAVNRRYKSQDAQQQPSVDDLFAEELSDFQLAEDVELPF